MFKKVLQSISKSLQRQIQPAKVEPKAEVAKPAPAPSKEVAAPAPEAKGKDKAAPKQQPAQKAAASVAPASAAVSPEKLCGIEPKMSKDQIRDRLKLLYRRYNRAASSLDNATRLEADGMLDAIVQVREKTFGEI